MKIHWTRSGAVGFLAAGLLLAAGCSSPPPVQESQPAVQPPRVDHSDAVRRLRGRRDAAFAELEGRPARKPELAKPVPDPISHRVAPAPAPVRTGKRPDWVGGFASTQYPRSQYIVGVGSCTQADAADKALALAEDRARSEAAKTIRVHIQSEFKSLARQVVNARGGKSSVKEDVTRIEEQIRSRADIVLEGLEIADRWLDRRKGTYWALAALNRATAGAIMAERLKQARQQAVTHAEIGRRLRGQGAALPALKHLSRSEREAFGVLNYRAQLRVVSPERLPPADPALDSLWRDVKLARDELRVGLTVFVVVEGRPASPGAAEAKLATMLRKTLGLNVVSVPAPPPGASYASMKGMDAARLRRWAGGKANALVLARVEAKYLGGEKLVSMLIHFYQARGEAVVLDLADGREAASVGFDTSPKTHTGKKQRNLAAEGALEKGAKELTSRLQKALAAALNAAP